MQDGRREVLSRWFAYNMTDNDYETLIKELEMASPLYIDSMNEESVVCHLTSIIAEFLQEPPPRDIYVLKKAIREAINKFSVDQYRLGKSAGFDEVSERLHSLYMELRGFSSTNKARGQS